MSSKIAHIKLYAPAFAWTRFFPALHLTSSKFTGALEGTFPGRDILANFTNILSRKLGSNEELSFVSRRARRSVRIKRVEEVDTFAVFQEPTTGTYRATVNVILSGHL